MRVGLYGGSYNPGHAGHLHVALEALKRLRLDAVWFMVSPGNPLKADTDMAPFEARLESARDLADHHPGLHAVDIEDRIGTRRTADTLFHLQSTLRHTRFVWMMGADNLATFHTWYRWTHIARRLPIAIFDRPGYSMPALSSRMARRFRRFRVSPEHLATKHGPAWAFVRIPRHPASATRIRALMGFNWVDDGFSEDISEDLTPHWSGPANGARAIAKEP